MIFAESMVQCRTGASVFCVSRTIGRLVGGSDVVCSRSLETIVMVGPRRPMSRVCNTREGATRADHPDSKPALFGLRGTRASQSWIQGRCRVVAEEPNLGMVVLSWRNA